MADLRVVSTNSASMFSSHSTHLTHSMLDYSRTRRASHTVPATWFEAHGPAKPAHLLNHMAPRYRAGQEPEIKNRNVGSHSSHHHRLCVGLVRLSGWTCLRALASQHQDKFTACHSR